MKQVLYATSVDFSGNNTNTYVNLLSPVFGGGNPFNAGAACPIPVAGTLRNLQVTLEGTVAPGAIRTFTLYKNGSATDMAFAITAGNSEGSDLSHEVTVAAGDLISLHQSLNSPNNDTNWMVQMRVEFEADDDATTIYATGEGEQLDNNTTNYISILGGTTGPSTSSEALNSNLASVDGTLTSLYVNFASAPPVGESYTFVVMKNGVAQDGTGDTVDTTLVASTSSANVSFSLPIEAFDLVSVRAVPSSSAVGGIGVRVCASFVADTDGQRHVCGSSADALTGGTTTEYHPPHGSHAEWTTTESRALHRGGVEPLALGGLFVRLSEAPGTGKSWTFTLRKNGAATGIAVTIANSETEGTIAGDVVIDDGDSWSLQVAPSGSPSSTATAKWTFTPAPSSRNTVTGRTHTVTGRDNLIAGALGTLSGERSVLFSLDGDPHSVSGSGTFWIFGRLIINGVEFEVAASGSEWSPLTTGDPSSPEIVFDSNGDVVMVETLR